MQTRQKYQIVTLHPSGYQDGEHEVTVSVNQDGTRYVNGKDFGCSRDYRVADDRAAVLSLLHEHGMSLTRIKKVRV